MATPQDIAETVKQLRGEMARRIDELLDETHIDEVAAESMGGIIEWLGSVEEALRVCDGVPSPSMLDRARARSLKLSLPDGVEDGFWCRYVGPPIAKFAQDGVGRVDWRNTFRTDGKVLL